MCFCSDVIHTFLSSVLLEWNTKVFKLMGRKSADLSVDIRERIIKSYEENKNISELSRIFGIPRTTIGSVIKKFNQTGFVENRSGRGSKKLFTVRDSTALSRVVKQNRRRSLADITTKFNENKEHAFCKKTIYLLMPGFEGTMLS